MATTTENAENGHWLKWFVGTDYCLEVKTITSVALAMYKGDVLEIESGVKLKALVSGQNDPTAVLMEDITLADLTAADVEALCLTKGPAIFDPTQLVWSGTATYAGDWDATLEAAFAALHIRQANAELADWEQQTT